MVLNFVPLTIENQNFQIYRVFYRDEDQLKELRRNFNTTNSFFRVGDYIYHSPMEKSDSYYGGDEVEISSEKDVEITKRLLHHVMFRKVLQTGSIMSEFAPVKFFTRDRGNDLLSNFLDNQEKKKVGFWKGYKVDSRVIEFNSLPTYGLVLNVFYSWKIKITCASLAHLGLDLEERYVELYNSAKPEIFKTNRRIAGKIISYDEEYALVEKEDIRERYLLDELFLENSHKNKTDVLNAFLGQEKASANFNRLSNSTQERSGAKGRLTSIIELSDWLKQLEFSNYHGFSFTLGEFIEDYDHLWQSIDIPAPTFVFNIHNTQTDTWHDRGLKKYGPYSKDNFFPAKPQIAVIFRKNKRGDVSKFIGKFRDGLPNVKAKNYEPYSQGFASKYRFSSIDFKPFEVEDESIKSYDKTIRQLLEEHGDTIDLAIIESCEDYKGYLPEENPYYFAKAKFLKYGIPTQTALYENMVLPDKKLAYILNNISLAIYSKIGGIPWVTPAEPNVDYELVIGIGNKVFKEDRYSISRRIVGITTIFTGDGNYLLSNTSKDVPYEDYLDELKRSLRLNIEKVKMKYNWKQGDTIRLVFHVFKPFKNDEIVAVEETVGDLQNEYNIIFAYINISKYQPFLIFDKSQDGAWDFNNYGKKKGIWQPTRRTNLKISNYQHLIQLTGPNEVKSWRQGMTGPILIKLHENSSFVDINYLTRQIYKFSCTSWRGFLPSSLPVTLEYSTQIADVLGNLRRSGHWDNDLIPDKLKFKTWFL